MSIEFDKSHKNLKEYNATIYGMMPNDKYFPERNKPKDPYDDVDIRTGTCSLCGDENIDVACFDNSSGEYNSIKICRSCTESIRRGC